MNARGRREVRTELFWVIQHLRTAELFCEDNPEEKEQMTGLLRQVERQVEALRAQIKGEADD